MEACPDCGARLGMSETCQSIFDALLALEFSDPAYGEVHFLTVTCFMIQHNRYSDQALAWIRPQLHAFLAEGVNPVEIRRRAAVEMGNGQRDWNVVRSPQDRPLPMVPWQVTIVEVAEQVGDAASYRKAVRLWGESTLKQMDVLLNGSVS